jgi:hypothetical protein
MRVRARQVDYATAPKVLRLYLGQPLVTVGKEYDVHAVAVFEGRVMMQIITDADWPSWRTAWLFDVIDRSIPSDWICATFHDEPSLVLGPEFIARSIEDYEAMVELVTEKVDRFWQRVEALEEAAREADAED